MQSDNIDVIVIGSGASGGFACKELTEKGLRVLLLEAGPDIRVSDFPSKPTATDKRGINLWPRIKATLAGQHIQSRLVIFNARFKKFFINDRDNPYFGGPGAPFLWIRGRQMGGRLHTFGRVLLRWSNLDFKGCSQDGQGMDWPISYEDLAPYYDEVETYLQVRGTDEGVASLPDGHYAGPSALVEPERTLKSRVEKFWPSRKVIPWRYMPPFPQRVPTPILDALATGRLTSRSNALAARINCDPTGKLAESVEYIDTRTNTRQIARARLIVVAASPVETVRLLLNSCSPQHPRGLGNAHDILGRYFMDQCPSIVYAQVSYANGTFFDSTAIEDSVYPSSGGFYIPRYTLSDTSPSGAPYRGFTYQGVLGRMPTSENEPSRLVAMGFGEMLPYADNRITVHHSKTDKWGIPVPVITCTLHENERALLARQEADIVDMVERTGGSIEFHGSPLNFVERGRGAFPDAGWISRVVLRHSFHMSMCMGAAIHESGGARMGISPETSYLNNRNQCWAVPNVLVTDASSFASSGSVGTTLTVMALTVRACRLAVERMNVV